MPYVGKSMDRKRNKSRQQLSGSHTAESWNARYPVGTPVRYWPIYPPRDGFPAMDTVTRSEAWALGDGSVVVLIDGKSGGVHLSHVEVLSGEEMRAQQEGGVMMPTRKTPIVKKSPETVSTGDVFETRDPREAGRRVKVLRKDGNGRWVCEVVALGKRGGKNLGRQTTISYAVLTTRYRKV